MAYKLLGALVTNPSNNTVGSATTVACNLATTGIVEVQGPAINGGAWESKGTIHFPVGIHKILKNSDWSVTFTGQATSVAHSD